MHGNTKIKLDGMLFKESIYILKMFVPSEITRTNRHLLILDEHGYHVTL
jgi:hypothetical protein